VILAMNCRNSEKWFLVEGEVLETQLKLYEETTPSPVTSKCSFSEPQ
jgi:hypothetical protein